MKTDFFEKLRTDLEIFTIFGVHALFDHKNWANLSKWDLTQNESET